MKKIIENTIKGIMFITLVGVLLINVSAINKACEFKAHEVGDITYKDSTRNYEYERYCDSIWVANPDYYMDVLSETDEYQEYIDKHGEWFK